MKFVSFLSDNFLWIILIILISIITIIGFLADKKRETKNSKEQPVPQNNDMNNTQPVNMDGMQNIGPQMAPMNNQMNNMNFNQPIPQPMTTEINNNTQESSNSNNIIPNQNVPVNDNSIQNMMQQPSETNDQNKKPELPYQPLSEQKPHFEPQPVPNFSNNTNNEINQNSNPTMNFNQPSMEQQSNMSNSFVNGNINNNTTPLAVPSNQMPQPMSEQYQSPMQNFNLQPMNQPNMNNSFANSNMNNNTTPMAMQSNQMPQQSLNPMQNFNPQPMNQPNMNNSFNGNNNINQTQGNIIPIPQPVQPQSIMQNTYNQPMMNQNYTVPQQPTQNFNQQAMPTNNQGSPVSFVFGPPSNNQNM